MKQFRRAQRSSRDASGFPPVFGVGPRNPRQTALLASGHTTRQPNLSAHLQRERTTEEKHIYKIRKSKNNRKRMKANEGFWSKGTFE